MQNRSVSNADIHNCSSDNMDGTGMGLDKKGRISLKDCLFLR